jgi:hypothetical protein
LDEEKFLVVPAKEMEPLFGCPIIQTTAAIILLASAGFICTSFLLAFPCFHKEPALYVAVA